MASQPTVATPKPDSRKAARRVRHAARSTLWRESSLKRVRHCGRFASGDVVTVKATGAGQERRAGLAGVQSCGSVWACPVCSEKINATRQAELVEGMTWWLAQGGGLAFGTLTMRHTRGDRLEDLLDAIGPAWNRTTSGAGVAWNGSSGSPVTKSGRPRKSFQVGDRTTYGIEGYTRTVEIKDGVNGWHPHVHFVLFLAAPLSRRGLMGLEDRMFGRWQAALADRGYTCLREVAIDLQPVESVDDAVELSAYLTKSTYRPTAGRVAYEMTGSVTKRLGKGGRSPFDLLVDVVEQGLADSLARWWEYEAATKGRRQLTWSRGLRERLRLGAELTDQEVVEDDALDGEPVAYLLPGDYKDLARAGLVADLLDQVEADDCGTRLREWLRERGFPPTRKPLRRPYAA